MYHYDTNFVKMLSKEMLKQGISITTLPFPALVQGADAAETTAAAEVGY